MSMQSVDKKRTARYVRVSTNKESQKMSPENQLGICDEKARELGLDINNDLIYEDKSTGTTIVDRPAIQQMLRDAQQGLFDAIIFASLSRFARDTADALDLKRKLVNVLGIRLISIEDHYDSAKSDDEFLFTITSAVNQRRSEEISLSSRRGIRQSAKRGNFTGSFAPFGYKKKIVDKKRTLVPDEETRHIVKLIFDLYTAHNMGEKAIANYLNEKNIPSPKGGKWGITTIQRILQNEVYIGRNVFCKYTTTLRYQDVNDLTNRKKVLVQRDKSEWERADDPQTHEAIIDEQVFQKAQEIRLERGGGKRGGIRNKVNVFAGLIKCKHCGSSMVSMKCKSGKKSKQTEEYRYLICSKRRRQGEAGCKNKFWLPYYQFRDDLIEELVTRIRSITSVEQLLEKHKDKIKVQTKDFEKEIKQLEKQLEQTRYLLLELRKQKMLGQISEAQFQFEEKQYNKEISDLENQLAKIIENQKKKDDITQLYNDIMDSLEELLDLDYDEFDQLHLTLKKLIEKITVDLHGNIDVKTTFGVNLTDLTEESRKSVTSSV
nr:recombinase family protein [Anoxybacillus sp.]